MQFLITRNIEAKSEGEGLYQAKYELGESYYQTKNRRNHIGFTGNCKCSRMIIRKMQQIRVAQIYIAQGNLRKLKNI